jgi:predicted transcriptional regulator of viral defense system
LDHSIDRSGTSLSARELSLLADWERARRVQVTLDEIRSLVGATTAPDVVKALVRKGVLERVGRGNYLVHPVRTLSRGAVFSSPVLVATLMRGRPYYLGGLWAFAQHQLTSQVYGSVLDVYGLRTLRSRRLGNSLVRCHVVTADAMEVGVKAVPIEGVLVRISDPERTLLDALEHPSAVGGTDKALELVWHALSRVDSLRLVDYAAKGARSSTCQRLGLLLERAGISIALLRPLKMRAQTSSSVLSLLPGARRTGRVHPVWHVVENEP